MLREPIFEDFALWGNNFAHPVHCVYVLCQRKLPYITGSVDPLKNYSITLI